MQPPGLSLNRFEVTSHGALGANRSGCRTGYSEVPEPELLGFVDQNRKYFADQKPPEAFWAYFQAQLDIPRTGEAFPYAHHVTLLEAIPGARLVPVEGAAHLPQYERPEAANGALLELLGRFREEAAPGPTLRVDFGRSCVLR